MPITEAIILAGGLGTRLRDAVPDLPKCMAPVNGKPFIFFLVKHLEQQGIKHFIFSLGFRSEAFIQYLSELLPSGNYELAIETEPLGTGGAIQFAGSYARVENVLVVNGDSLFKADLALLAEFHEAHNSYCTLALKPMQDFDRFGSVELNEDDSIASFQEKKHYEEGLINGGVYIVNIKRFLQEVFPERFSFETDYLQTYYVHGKIYGMIQDAYFIDIGIPEDYLRAQKELTD
jgi:D-glycero-alpha-D-manno-heptose 1-phosphate guanylyltransferase